MDEQYIKSLLDKYKAGTITDAEKAVLDKWYLHVAVDSSEELSEAERLQTFDSVLAHLEQVAQPARTRRLWPQVAAAASIIVALSAGGYLLLHQKPKVEQVAVVQDIAPGKNTATLTLANGQRIVLSTALKGQLAVQAGVRVNKTADGQLVYTVSDQSSETNKFNTLATARGEQYQVVLPDGTHVWLNAASSLKYPASFANLDQRKVELNGEAYFEVAKDKAHPFIVQTAQQDVEVLGTHFNINSYTDEQVTKTTLLEGSVQVTESSGTHVRIKPGEQATLKNNKLKISEADIDATVAWKNGEFLFNDETLGEIMRSVSRWYDVEISYQDGIDPNQSFMGGVSRYDNVSKVIRELEKAGGIHFKIEGRRIIIGK